VTLDPDVGGNFVLIFSTVTFVLSNNARLLVVGIVVLMGIRIF